MEKSQSKVLKIFNNQDHRPMTIKESKEYFSKLSMEKLPDAIQAYSSDTRKGIQEICKQYSVKYKSFLNEKARLQLLQEFDQVFTNNGQYLLVGIDEAGRGPLAGPVVAAAVILPIDSLIVDLNDSKKIDEARREKLYDEIMEKAISVGVGIVDAKVIDEINILQATFKAMKEAIRKLTVSPEVILVDGNQLIPGVAENINQHAITKGDAKSSSIAAASIIAKVTRDRIMRDYHCQYPLYGFLSNKGYGSNLHQIAIREFGPTPIHRKSFIKNIFNH